MGSKPPIKDFANLINKIAGKSVMTEKMLKQILSGAKKSFDADGMDGFLGYLRDVTKAPVSMDWMKQVVDQIKTPQGLNQMTDQLNIPLKAKKSGSRVVVEKAKEKKK